MWIRMHWRGRSSSFAVLNIHVDIAFGIWWSSCELELILVLRLSCTVRYSLWAVIHLLRNRSYLIDRLRCERDPVCWLQVWMNISCAILYARTIKFTGGLEPLGALVDGRATFLTSYHVLVTTSSVYFIQVKSAYKISMNHLMFMHYRNPV